MPEASPCPTRPPTTPPAVCRRVPGVPVQRREPAARDQHHARSRRSATAVLARVQRSLSFLRLRKMRPAPAAQHHREQEGRPAEQEEQEVREPGARQARCCCGRRACRQRREPRVVRAVAGQRHEDHEGQHADGEGGALAQASATAAVNFAELPARAVLSANALTSLDRWVVT